MKRAWLWLAIGLTACDGCERPQPDEDAAAATARAPEAWTMGAADDDAALPPPCRGRAEPLRAVLLREARLSAARGVLGQVFFAEGAVPVGQSAWHPDTSGVIRPEHGRGSVSLAPWPRREPPRFARAGDGWLGLVDRDGGLLLWREPPVVADGDANDFERLGPHPAMRGGDLACDEAQCALLTSRLDASGSVVGGGATLWLGHAAEPAASWARADLPAADAAPLSIAAFDAQAAMVALIDSLRVRVVSVRDGAVTSTVTLSAPHGALAASAMTAAGRPAALIHVAPHAMRCSESDAGGVSVVVANAAPQRLRSAAAASEASLVPLPGGWLAVWLAPAHCETPRQLLHAAVLTAEGTPVAPVTTIAEADGYAVAARGQDVDLWLRLGGGGQPSTVSWLRIACPLPDG